MIFYCPPLITSDSTIIPFTMQKDSNWYSKVVLRVFLSTCALFTLKILGSNCFHRELNLIDDQMWISLVKPMPDSVSRSVVSNSFVTPWTVAHQVLLSMEFSRQEYWGGLPFPSPICLCNTTESPEINSCIYSQIIFDKRVKNTQWDKDNIFNKVWGKLNTHVQKN